MVGVPLSFQAERLPLSKSSQNATCAAAQRLSPRNLERSVEKLRPPSLSCPAVPPCGAPASLPPVPLLVPPSLPGAPEVPAPPPFPAVLPPEAPPAAAFAPPAPLLPPLPPADAPAPPPLEDDASEAPPVA